MKDILKRLIGRNVSESQKAVLASGRRPRPFTFGYDWHMYESSGNFYRYLRNRVPIISAAVWNWVRLCNTPGTFHLTGNEPDKREAEEVITGLFERIPAVSGAKRKGLGSMLEFFFLEIFTCGNFSGRIIPLASGKGIDYFDDIDIAEFDSCG